jgi:protein-S-isoprenylcysteine O-methyltransferase Ste14
VYFLGSGVAMFLLDRFVPIATWSGSGGAWVGGFILVGGVILTSWGNGLFRFHKTPVKPFQESRVLVTDGVFRVSRNPMYLGMVLFLIGLGFVLGSLSPFFVVPAFVAVIDVRFIRVEEARLTEQFNEAYVEYRKKVRRWL